MLHAPEKKRTIPVTRERRDRLLMLQELPNKTSGDKEVKAKGEYRDRSASDSVCTRVRIVLYM